METRNASELTDTGRHVLAEARRLRLRFVRQALADPDDADLDTLAALIERFNASIRNAAW